MDFAEPFALGFGGEFRRDEVGEFGVHGKQVAFGGPAREGVFDGVGNEGCELVQASVFDMVFRACDRAGIDVHDPAFVVGHAFARHGDAVDFLHGVPGDEVELGEDVVRDNEERGRTEVGLQVLGELHIRRG